ncbi:MAG TPA: hypothetical protein ENK28_12445 [Aliiroseovarius sp.]|nr:hypothetical protein [Aliiroseovarius sp.]
MKGFRHCTTVVLACLSMAAMAGEAADRMVLIPAGEFIMGSDKVATADESIGVGATKPWYLDEHPRHRQTLPAYYIDRYEVTNREYAAFVAATGHAAPINWANNGYILRPRLNALRALPVEKLRRLGAEIFRLDMDTRQMDTDALIKAFEDRLEMLDREPVTYVTWRDARAYCNWAGGRLPTEAEWEKAARGRAGHEFPWGNEWQPAMANAGDEFWEDGVAPVGSYEGDKSDYGVYDLAGNVSEWVQDWYQPYPGSDYSSADFGEKFKLIRGAGWGREGHYALHLFLRAAYRFYLNPESAHEDLGFRCAKDAVTSAAQAGFPSRN